MGAEISSTKVDLSCFWGNFDDFKWSMRREIFMTPVDLINLDKENPLNGIPLYHSAAPFSATWLDLQIYGSCTQEIQRAWNFRYWLVISWERGSNYPIYRPISRSPDPPTFDL